MPDAIRRLPHASSGRLQCLSAGSITDRSVTVADALGALTGLHASSLSPNLPASLRDAISVASSLGAKPSVPCSWRSSSERAERSSATSTLS